MACNFGEGVGVKKLFTSFSFETNNNVSIINII